MELLYYGPFFIWNLYLILLKLKHNLVNLEQQRERAFCQNIPNIMAGEPVWESVCRGEDRDTPEFARCVEGFALIRR